MNSSARSAIAGHRHPSLVWWLVLLLTLSACDRERVSAVTQRNEERQVDAVQRFLQDYWARPLQSQGVPPAALSTLEKALDPGACGTCHTVQFTDWKTTLHARTMGPGVLGQLKNTAPQATEEQQDCLRCHAPLKEQADGLVADLSEASSVESPLHGHGLVCAACHMRNFQRYGPARSDGSLPDPATALPHGGWIANAAFEDSRFCAACHQFPEDWLALNGKLLENTYEEWRASRYPAEGKTCQSCHMPKRRHLWRGIHDPETARAGVTIEVTRPVLSSGTLSARLAIQNTGTGHYFPTYVTPKIVVEAYQENGRGAMVDGTQREQVIARQVAADLSAEIADTRIAPGEQALFDYRVPRRPDAVALVFRVRVEPDAFYTELYRSLLGSKQAGKGETLIKSALAASTRSHYTLYLHREALSQISRQADATRVRSSTAIE